MNIKMRAYKSAKIFDESAIQKPINPLVAELLEADTHYYSILCNIAYAVLHKLGIPFNTPHGFVDHSIVYNTTLQGRTTTFDTIKVMDDGQIRLCRSHDPHIWESFNL